MSLLVFYRKNEARLGGAVGECGCGSVGLAQRKAARSNMTLGAYFISSKIV